MAEFFTDAAPYLNADNVVSALTSIAQASAFSGVDHLSVEISAILNALPATLTAPPLQENLTDLLYAITYNQSNPEVTAAELNNTMKGFVSHYGAFADVNDILSAATSLAINDTVLNTDHVSSIRTLLQATPDNQSSATLPSLQYALTNIAQLSNDTQVTPAELNSMVKTFITHYGTNLDVSTILTAASYVAEGDQNYVGDHLSTVRMLLNLTPADAASASASDMQRLLRAIGQEQLNPEATTADINNTLKTLISHYGANIDAVDILSVAASIAVNDSYNYTDSLSSVRILLAAMPANQSSVGAFDVGNVLNGIAQNAFNPNVTPEELNNTLKALASQYGAAADVFDIFGAASDIARNDAQTYSDHLSSVRTLLASTPANQGTAEPFDLQSVIESIAQNAYNPAVTPEELNKTLKVFVSHYGTAVDVLDIFSVISDIARNDAQSYTDHLSSVRTLLAATPANQSSVGPFDLQQALESITQNAPNPAVTAEELNNTLKVFVSHYGALTDVSDILRAVSDITNGGVSSGTDHLSSVRTLILASPDNMSSADPDALQSALGGITFNRFNPGITAEELNDTLKAYLTHYGAIMNVNNILNEISSIANDDRFASADHSMLMQTLLSANPDNIADADTFGLSSALQYITGNNTNTGMSEYDLAQTLDKFMANYGALTDADDLSNSILSNTQAGKFEAAGAIVNHLDATQFTSIAPDLNTYSTAELLTTGNDHFNGAISGKLAVYGGAGKDVIDFSSNTSAAGHYLDGGSGADTLIGGLADDTMVGGAGANTMTGGAGADIFRFDHINGTLDHVTDFSAAQGDRIDLHDVLHSDAALNIADYVTLQTVGGNTIVSVDVDGTGTGHSFVQVAQLDNTTGLDLNDLYAQGQIIV
ncbi:MAG: type I secretion C-terminal target domain-containing protein [Micavibrio sp.]|nr:type I secretion C-terminal target domain-containing protein [Micavibrio sp.]